STANSEPIVHALAQHLEAGMPRSTARRKVMVLACALWPHWLGGAADAGTMVDGARDACARLDQEDLQRLHHRQAAKGCVPNAGQVPSSLAVGLGARGHLWADYASNTGWSTLLSATG